MNIAEILKDCPKGMELDCTMYDNVTFVRVDNSRKQFPIEISVSGIRSKYLTKEGCFHDTTLLPEAKCVIFPKGKTTWEGFVPPCKFKDGDIVYTNQGSIAIIYHKQDLKPECLSFCGLFHNKFDKDVVVIPKRLATEEEKQKLFDAIKANGYKWNAETKTLEKLITRNKFQIGAKITNGKIIGKIRSRDVDSYQLEDGSYVFFNDVHKWQLVPDKFDISTLKPFDKVLTRANNKDMWVCNLYSYSIKNYHVVLNAELAVQCIPYENNGHLLGTTEDCDEYYKTW